MTLRWKIICLIWAFPAGKVVDAPMFPEQVIPSCVLAALEG